MSDEKESIPHALGVDEERLEQLLTAVLTDLNSGAQVTVLKPSDFMQAILRQTTRPQEVALVSWFFAERWSAMGGGLYE